MSKDYYDILDVSKTASEEEIKKAFRKKAHQHHPDKDGGDEAKFKEINEAYQVLGNKDKRSQYDRFGSAYSNQAGGQGASGFGGFDGFSGQGINMDDLSEMFGGFGDIFGFGGGQNRRSHSTRGSDVQVNVSIPFMESVFGVEKEIKFYKTSTCKDCTGTGAEKGSDVETCKNCHGSGMVMKIQRTILGAMQMQTPCSDCQGEGRIITKPCKHCHGTGLFKDDVTMTVKIPAGISDGEMIRLTGQGEAGTKGGGTGDLYIKVSVNNDNRFTRKGDDIVSQATIGFPDAALGTKIDINTVDGLVSLKIPEGTQSGKIFILKSRGVPHLRSNGRGNHLVEVIVKTPTDLSKKQKQLLEEFKN
ncbi:MAG: molecular chaperone DnaJ [Candidatus Falkowbacteria bacterium]|nr:molecular chaperone DnaJ [Candidatus Falkowbacteria bacterium]